MKNIDQNQVYTGVVFAIVAPREDTKNPSGFITPDDKELQAYIASRRVKSCKNPGNINFSVPRFEGDRFYACRTNEFGLQQGQRVEFKVRENDNHGLPQAYDVKRIDSPVAQTIQTYVDPIQATIAKLQAEKASPSEIIGLKILSDELADEMPDDDDFEEEEILDDDQIDQDEVDYAVYYDEE